MNNLSIRSFLTTAALAVAFAILLIGLVVALPGPRAGAEHPPEYLAMGDSLAVGVGASDPTTSGFVPLFRATLGGGLSPGQSVTAPGAQRNASYLKLSNIAVRGETSTSLTANGQLAAAVALLNKRNQNSGEVDDVEVITLSIGGNDLTPVLGICISNLASCEVQAGAALQTFGANFGLILGQLRAAAGPDTRIVVMTYYNPLISAGCLPPGYDALAKSVIGQLNATIVYVAGLVPEVEVANVASAGIGTADLTGDCLHPNDSGHQKIADTFADVFTAS